MSHTWFRRANSSTLLAALLIGLCAGIATWAGERAYISTERVTRRNDVQATLRAANDLLARRLQSASREASQLASSPTIQSAYLRRDADALEKIAQTQTNVGFVLWNGRLVGERGVPTLRVSLRVFGAGADLGRVIVVAAPSGQLLATARQGHPHTHLIFAVSGRVIAASPVNEKGLDRAASLLRNSVNASLLVSRSGNETARIYAFRPAPSILLLWLWPWIPAAVVSGLATAFFKRRERNSRSEPPPSTVRQAVALVGETLAATHNPTALLPVILRAAIEATGAAGGVILSGQEIVVSQGAIGRQTTTEIEIPLEITEGAPPARLALFPPLAGFDADAHDAARWISDQAAIALENARLHRLVERQAVTDDLTGLPNRRQFLAQLDVEVSRAQRSGTPLALILSDLDDFKHVNDNWGHAVGDQALRYFATILRSTIRDIDLPARLGGEEFAVLLPDTDLAGGTELAERIRHLLAESTQAMTSQPIRITASFGVSCFPPIAAADDLLVDADKSLYRAKRRGKNMVVASEIAGSQAGSVDERPPRMG
jgi:diguanylate cyclase (GGDEF)-like protein